MILQMAKMKSSFSQIGYNKFNPIEILEVYEPSMISSIQDLLNKEIYWENISRICAVISQLSYFTFAHHAPGALLIVPRHRGTMSI